MVAGTEAYEACAACEAYEAYKAYEAYEAYVPARRTIVALPVLFAAATTAASKVVNGFGFEPSPPPPAGFGLLASA